MIPDDARALFERLLPGVEIHPELGPQIPPERVREVARALKEELEYRFFVYCAAAHFPPPPPKRGQEPVDGPEEIVVAYRVRRLGPGTASVPFHLRVLWGTPTPSLVPVYAGADWQEREQYDLVGALFEGHPDLRRIMMPEDWEGHPLRRDYAIDTPHFPWR